MISDHIDIAGIPGTSLKCAAKKVFFDQARLFLMMVVIWVMTMANTVMIVTSIITQILFGMND